MSKSLLYGTWDNNNFPTHKYTFDSTMNVKYQWLNDLGSYTKKGTYIIKGDTIIISYLSDTNKLSIAKRHPDFDTLIMLDKQNIFIGSDYDPNIIYVGAFLNKIKK